MNIMYATLIDAASEHLSLYDNGSLTGEHDEAAAGSHGFIRRRHSVTKV